MLVAGVSVAVGGVGGGSLIAVNQAVMQELQELARAAYVEAP